MKKMLINWSAVGRARCAERSANQEKGVDKPLLAPRHHCPVEGVAAIARILVQTLDPNVVRDTALLEHFPVKWTPVHRKEMRPLNSLERFRAEHVLGLDSGTDTGSREENASSQNHRALLLIPSEAKRL
jgi:hypothetical protein